MSTVSEAVQFQQTLAKPVRLSGVGVHSGIAADMVLSPAPADTGIVFLRPDLPNAQPIAARADQVTELTLGTTLSNKAGQTVATVEHFLAACSGLGIDNLHVALHGPEVPIMDGSSKVFVDAMREAGVAAQDSPRRRIKVLQPIEVSNGEKRARLVPSEDPWLTLDAVIEFESKAIGRQSACVTLTPGAFADEIGYARTFGFAHEVEALQKMGLARGGSLDNAIVIEDNQIANPEGLRVEDEFVRHKILDAIGDLMLAGAPIAGRYEAYLPGHALNNQLVRALFDHPEAWCWDDGRESA